MSTLHRHLLDATTAELAPSAAPSRIVSGTPECAELVLVDTGDVEIGLWEVTPGVFESTKNGIGEVMHFLSGTGHLENADGTITPIAPGVVAELVPGWSGVWHVETTVRKLYTIYTAPTA